jgi:hypothetical protein
MRLGYPIDIPDDFGERLLLFSQAGGIVGLPFGVEKTIALGEEEAWLDAIDSYIRHRRAVVQGSLLLRLDYDHTFPGSPECLFSESSPIRVVRIAFVLSEFSVLPPSRLKGRSRVSSRKIGILN